MKSGPSELIKYALRGFLLVALLLMLACSTSATAVPASPVASSNVATPTAIPTAVSTPVPPVAAEAPDREVVLGVWRNLANGEQDPYYMHDILMVWESLVDLDNQLDPFPQLAVSWSLSGDGLTWTFKLKEGISFSDGVPFNADATVANIERYMQINPRKSRFFSFTIARSYGDLGGISKGDDHTVAFQLNSPNASMPFTMSNFFSAMFSPDFFAENGDFTGIPAATGPFKLVEWKEDQFMLLERNESYWGQKPSVKMIRIRVIPDSGARVSALLAGEIEGVIDLGALAPAEAKSLEGKEGITVASDPVSQTLFLAFGTDRPPFDNVNLRRAVSMAVNRQAIVDTLLLGYGEPGRSLFSAFAPQWLSPKAELTFAPAQAQELAQTALRDSRASATLIYRSGAGQAVPRKAIAELLQSDLAKLGIDLKLVPLERAAERERVASGDWNIRITQQAWANGDPDFVMANFLSSTGSFNSARKGGYSNPEVDQLVAAGKAEPDREKRYLIYEQLQEIAARDVPIMPIYHWRLAYAYRDSITGFSQRINYQPTLDEIKIVK